MTKSHIHLYSQHGVLSCALGHESLNLDYMRIKSVLFVCLGNICRSPLAEVILVKHIKQKGWEHLFHVDSAGTGHWHIGEPAHVESIRVAKQNGIDLSVHRARQVECADFDKYEHIVAMDTSNLDNLNALKKDKNSDICLIREFDSNCTHIDLPDPYFGGPAGFDEVFEILDRTCLKYLEAIRLN